MSNYSKWNAKQDPRTELHDVLGLTGAEISINHLPAGVGVPFVHSHKKNEEIYIILPAACKMEHDAVGHYARPDVLQLTIKDI